MVVEVRGQKVELNPEVRTQLQGRVRGALERFSRQIRRVTVRVLEARATPSPMPSKVCRITLEMDAGGQFYAEEAADTLAGAVQGALESSRTLLRRNVGDRQRGDTPGKRRVALDVHA